MYSRFAFALLFSFCAFGLGIAIPAFPDEKCGANAEFSHCGSACVPDCANQEEPKICTLQCVVGCFCKKGFLKNAQGQCVLPQDCEARIPKIPMQKPSAAMPTCPDNEVFNPCGSACAPTCADPNPSPICTRQCVVGCFCKEGHLRNANGICVPAEKCEAPKTSMFFAYPPEMTQCKDNEVFLPCGSACAPTCANPHPTICTTQCISGCFCKPGYLKNEQGVCMPAENCGVAAADAIPIPPQVCEENEEFRQCKGCDGTCDKPNPICPRICIPGCACKAGHVRSGPNGRCMPKEQCPAPAANVFMMLPPNKCNANEVFHTCGTACPATCANPNPSPVCTKNCVIGCFCKEGYLKNEMGVCVPAADCKATPVKTEGKCASDREMFVEDCGSQMDCVATCTTPLSYMIHGVPQIPKKCQQTKCAASCVCKFPYYRNSAGQCVERQACDNQ